MQVEKRYSSISAFSETFGSRIFIFTKQNGVEMSAHRLLQHLWNHAQNEQGKPLTDAFAMECDVQKCFDLLKHTSIFTATDTNIPALSNLVRQLHHPSIPSNFIMDNGNTIVLYQTGLGTRQGSTLGTIFACITLMSAHYQRNLEDLVCQILS